MGMIRSCSTYKYAIGHPYKYVYVYISYIFASYLIRLLHLLSWILYHLWQIILRKKNELWWYQYQYVHLIYPNSALGYVTWCYQN